MPVVERRMVDRRLLGWYQWDQLAPAHRQRPEEAEAAEMAETASWTGEGEREKGRKLSSARA